MDNRTIAIGILFIIVAYIYLHHHHHQALGFAYHTGVYAKKGYIVGETIATFPVAKVYVPWHHAVSGVFDFIFNTQKSDKYKERPGGK